MVTTPSGIACFDRIEAAYEFAARHKLTIPAHARLAVCGHRWALQCVPDGRYLGVDGNPIRVRSRAELDRERGVKAGRDLAQRFARLVDLPEEQRALARRMAASWWIVHAREGEHFNQGMLEALGLHLHTPASGTWTIVPK